MPIAELRKKASIRLPIANRQSAIANPFYSSCLLSPRAKMLAT
jgi:hypothetical protein